MRLIILALAGLLWGCAPDAPDATAPAPTAAPVATGPIISDAWIRQVPPAARMTAAYLRVHNPGTKPLVIVGAASPLFNSIEMHGTVMADGVARMRRQDTVTVAPGATVNFQPGGLHFMLMQPINNIPSSGNLELSLVLDDGERVEFTAPVMQPGN